MAWQEEDLPEPPRVTWWHAWSETALLSAVGPALGFRFRPDDPLFVHASFCWLLLGPLLVALRYGTLHGLAAAGVLVAAIVTCAETQLPGPLICGILLVVLIAGAMTDRLSRRAERAERTGRFALNRTSRFIRAYHAMTASHELLERAVRNSGSSLREALAALRRRLAARPGSEEEAQGTRKAVLDLFAQYAGVHLATFHSVDRTGTLSPPDAMLGEAPFLLPSHPMLQEALQQKRVVSVPAESADEPGLIAAVPLVDVMGRVTGVVAIHEMPFTSLTEDMLQLIAVLSGAVADLLSAFQRSEPETEQQAFVVQLRRALQDQQRHGLDTALVCLTLDDPQGGERLAALGGERRASDHTCMTQDAAGEPVLAVLLPLTSETGAQSFTGRLEQLAQQAAEEPALEARIHSVTRGDTIESLVSFIREPRHSNDTRRVRLAGV